MFVTILIALIVLLLVAGLIAGVFFAYVYWWLAQRPVPRLDGTVTLPCLQQAVEILRDRHAVPHIYAQNRADLFRAQGYVHAQERLWQMEQNRRIASGTLAEVFGDVALDADRFSRIIGFRRAAEAELESLDTETRQIMDWYCEGVNAYIQARPGRLAAELNLLRVQLAPWTALDCLAHGKIMAWSLGSNWDAELTRVRLMERLGPIRAADLDPDFPGKNPLILEGVDSVEATRLLTTAGLLLNEYDKLKEWLVPASEGQGSNSWVVAPKNTTTRTALLCNDPHLGVQMPGVWYENHLSCPDYVVSGASMCGMPGVIIGHNEQIAWGMTNAFVDVQDLYIERRHPEHTTLFRYGEEWEQAEVVEESIRVRRRKDPIVEKVVITRHGPVISNLLVKDQKAGALSNLTLAMRWAGHDAGYSSARCSNSTKQRIGRIFKRRWPIGLPLPKTSHSPMLKETLAMYWPARRPCAITIQVLCLHRAGTANMSGAVIFRRQSCRGYTIRRRGKSSRLTTRLSVMTIRTSSVWSSFRVPRATHLRGNAQ